MENFTEWWDGLTFSLAAYWTIALVFSLFFVLQLILSAFGGDGVPDDTPDAEIAADTGIPFQFFSIKNFIGFFTIFGWAGIAALDMGFSEFGALVTAFASGLVMMTMMASLFYLLAKANADGSLKMNNAIGGVGEVYLTIPKQRNSIGKVQINVQGAVRTLDAMTDDDQDIPTGKIIKVKEIVNQNILLVTSR
ncbi:MAG TPA: hypothetical protein VGD65_09645 [Chryseosolibacter sp.]